MAGASQSVSKQQSTSQSSSYIPDYPQSSLLQAIAQYASQLGDATYNWGQQQYAKTSGITDQNINSYLTTSAQALQNANNDQQRYQALFQPEENQLIKDANSYNSLERQQYEMGKAESRAGAGMDAARQNHERQLLSYGIDPSAGRYDALDRADQLAKSAAQVGAGQQAYDQTAATGRQLRADAIQVGARYPGQITNEQNTALQGIAGAENSNLANANTGIALNNAAKGYLDTASSLKYPPLGSSSSSQSSGTSQSSSVSSDGGGGGGGSKGEQQPQQQSGGGGGGSGGGGSGGGGGGYPNNGNGDYGDDMMGNNGGTGGGDDIWNNGTSGFNDYGLGGYDDWTGGFGGSAYAGDGIGSSDYGSSGYPYSDGGSYFGNDYGGGGWGDYSGYGGASDYASAGDFGGGGEYARGGPVQGGGRVPASMSPSRGAIVDDIPAMTPRGPAKLNANEFVIPQDVALYKGQEFFQKLIAAARKNNAMAAAKPRFGGGQHAAQ